MAMFGLKITKEDFQDRANADISHLESRFLEGRLSSSDLREYLNARATKEFFADIVASHRNPEIDFVDLVEYLTKPNPADPLNRSTSTLHNMLDDLSEHLKGQVYSHILRLREVQAERAAKAAEESN